MNKTEPTMVTDFPLIAAARSHALHLWNEQHDPRLVFHNFAQAAGVAERAEELARLENLPEASVEAAVLAAWFHNVGYLYDATRPVETSAIRAEFFLVEQGSNPGTIRQVCQCITDSRTENRPKSPEARVLSDAIHAFDWVEDFDSRAPLLRMERELLSGQPESDAEWEHFLDEQMGRCVFFTAFAKTRYEPALALRRAWRRATPVPDSAPPKKNRSEVERFDRLARRPMRSSIQTFFRANYANHIRLSAIADNKAHIMISVNSILLSVAISLLTYQTLTNRNPLYVLPIIMFLVTSLSSLTFAVLSSRPRVTSLGMVSGQPPSPIFFGNFVHLSLDQYEAATDAMLRDGRLLFGNMARDVYFLGLVLDKKYRLLTYSYTVFMMGFVATVGAFIGAYFLGE
ncbi:MAG: Pycsar system effector family protein [Saprospiraceae bacterium]